MPEENVPSLAKMQQDTKEFRAEVRDMFHVVGLRQEELNLKLDNHIEVVEPILKALAFSKTAVVIIKWSSGFLIGIGTIYLLAKQVVRGY